MRGFGGDGRLAGTLDLGQPPIQRRDEFSQQFQGSGIVGHSQSISCAPPALCETTQQFRPRKLYDVRMTARPRDPVDTTTTHDAQPTYGFGRQSRGSRKGLGGDPPNAPVERQKLRRDHEITAEQVSEMESEGQGQK